MKCEYSTAPHMIKFHLVANETLLLTSHNPGKQASRCKNISHDMKYYNSRKTVLHFREIECSFKYIHGTVATLRCICPLTYYQCVLIFSRAGPPRTVPTLHLYVALIRDMSDLEHDCKRDV